MAEGQISNPATGVSTANQFASIAFEVEFANDSNGNTLCPITKRRWRGRWSLGNMKNRLPDDNFNMPDLPGMRVQVNGKNRKVHAYDPLSLTESRNLLKEARTVAARFGIGSEPEKPYIGESLNDDDLKQWCYWCRRWIDNGQVVLLAGRIPEMAAILALPGQVVYNSFDLSGPSPVVGKVPAYRPPSKSGTSAYVTDDEDDD